MSNEIINSDIYNITKVVSDLQKRYFEETDESTLALSLNGFLNAVTSKMIQTNIQVVSEQANEVFPTKARFEKNIIAHAYANNISNIEATPAKINIQLALSEEDVTKLLNSNSSGSFTLDRELKIYIGDYEYHLDYDMIINKQTLSNNISVYTAMYDMAIANNLSDISNPNLASPYVIPRDGKSYIFVQCHLRQVEHSKYYEKVLTNSSIDNKTFEFEFEHQLATFDIFATDGGVVTRLIPIFDSSANDTTEKYCKYSYINSNRIRVMFDSDSYMPSLNTEIVAEIRTTLGAKCNFEYVVEVTGSFEATDKFDYANLEYFFIPTSNSQNGHDKRSISELRKILPKEVLSKGILVTDTDLNNYFDNLNSSTTKTNFIEKVNNQIMRSYYCYLAMKDSLSNVIPTNTINIKIKESQFDSIVDPDNSDLKTLILKQGCKIGYRYESGSWYGTIITLENINEVFTFYYTLPFKMSITYSGPFISYYLNMMDNRYTLAFSYINLNSPLQFISTTAFWERGYLVNSDKYILTVKLLQNILSDFEAVTYTVGAEEEIIISNTTIKIIAVFYNSNGDAYRYMIGNIDDYDPDTFTSTFKFELNTSDIISMENAMRIEGMYVVGTDTVDYGYIPQNCNVDIYILNEFDGEEFGRNNLDDIVPTTLTAGYTLTNIYTVTGGVSLFDNFSEIVSSIVTVTEGATAADRLYSISSVPVIGYNFALNENNMSYVTEQLKLRKMHIDEALKILNYQFSIDFKYYNSYGPGKLLTVDAAGTTLIKVNVSLEFNISLKKKSDDYTKDYISRDIKNIIENIYNIDDIHFPNLVSDIFKTYSNSIYYIEFVGINGESADAVHQHIYYNKATDLRDVPEMLCIDIKTDGTPNIIINIV